MRQAPAGVRWLFLGLPTPAIGAASHPLPYSRPQLGTHSLRAQAGVAHTLGAGGGEARPLTLCLLPVGGMAGVKRPPSGAEEEPSGKKASPTPARGLPLSPVSTNAMAQRKDGGAERPPLKAVSASSAHPLALGSPCGGRAG